MKSEIRLCASLLILLVASSRLAFGDMLEVTQTGVWSSLPRNRVLSSGRYLDLFIPYRFCTPQYQPLFRRL